MKTTQLKLILALALALAVAGGYFASTQLSFGGGGFGGGGGRGGGGFGGGGGFDGGGGGFGGGRGQRNNNGDYGFGQRNYNGYSTSAQSANVPGPTDYPRFSTFVANRNIFNPNRIMFVPGRPPVVQRTSRPTATPAFGLVGTMAYDKGMFAFFDGNNSEYQQVLYASDNNRIAGFIVSDVTPSGVTLQTADKKESMTLKIGQTLRQQDDGTWDLGGTTESFSSAGAAGIGAGSSASGSAGSLSVAPSAAGAAPASTAPSAAVQGNDILRRLMQERQQQLK